MATVRSGSRGALVVVDVQNGVMADAWESGRVVARVARAVDRARGADVPVVWVQHQDEELAPDSPEWEWVAGLEPADGEPLVHKQHNSAFERTSLEDELAALDVNHLVLAGAATNWCIRATAYAALERGYDLTLVGDAHTTSGAEAETVVDDLNAVMSWVSYAEVSNTAAAAEEVDFAALGRGD